MMATTVHNNIHNEPPSHHQAAAPPFAPAVPLLASTAHGARLAALAARHVLLGERQLILDRMAAEARKGRA